MKNRTAATLLIAGLVAGLALGSTALGFAATTKSAAKSSTAATSTPAPGRQGQMRGPGGIGGVGMVEVVAKLTGETTTTVAAARQSGTSFAKIASAKSVTVAQIVDLASAAPKAALDSEVSNGLITQADADTRLKDLKAHLTTEVSETGTRGPGPDGHGGPGGNPPQGPPPAQGSAPGSSTSSSSGSSN